VTRPDGHDDELALELSQRLRFAKVGIVFVILAAIAHKTKGLKIILAQRTAGQSWKRLVGAKL
jgi:hypothetical protein